jgi:hypothetical protein
MKTKNRIVALVFATLLAAFTFTFAGEIKDAVFNRILRLTAKELITKKFIAEASKSFHRGPQGSSTIDFQRLYGDARRTTYDLTISGEEYSDIGLLRVVVVASMKNQLHNGTTLVDVYKSCRNDFIAALSEERVEFRRSLLELSNKAINVFEKVKKPEFRKELQDLAFAEDVYIHGFDCSKIDKMLASNSTAEDIIRQIQMQQKQFSDISVVVPVDESRDRHLEGFALRRYEEGKDRLINQYLVLVRLMREDIKRSIN